MFAMVAMSNPIRPSFFGANNVGKTAIIDALRMVLMRWWGQRGTGFKEHDVHRADDRSDPRTLPPASLLRKRFSRTNPSCFWPRYSKHTAAAYAENELKAPALPAIPPAAALAHNSLLRNRNDLAYVMHWTNGTMAAPIG